VQRSLLVILIMLFASVAGLREAPAQTPTPVNAFPNLTFNNPVLVTSPPDGTNRIFVVQQGGIVRIFPNDSAATAGQARTFLDITARLVSGGEQGLLGLAFHPGFASNGLFYVNYTAPSPLRTVIARFRVDPVDPNRADSLSEYRILEINQPYTNHNGGMIDFGPDGYLYVGMGDGGSGNDPGNRAQNLSELLGKFLRIDVNDTTPIRRYRIPPDNPLAGNILGYREEIWAWGVRNPWRWSFDRPTGRLWAGDVGQGAREEIDLIQGGRNFGWRLWEGMIRNPAFPTGDTTGLSLVMPIKDYPRDSGASVTGGYVYRGYRVPAFVGAYIYADYVSGRVFLLRYQNGLITEDRTLIDLSYNVSTFGMDQNNELYYARYSTSGPLYRFAGPPLADPPTIAVAVPNGGERWTAATRAAIRWRSNNVRGPVRVELSRDGGATYAAVDSQAANLGGLVWTVTGPGTQNARIRILSVAAGTVVDSSDAPFTIAAAAIAVVPPIVLFGDVQFGTTARETTFVQNAGTDTLRIAQVTVDSAAFAVVRYPTSVRPGGVDTLIVSFSPTAVRAYSGTLRIVSNGVPSPLTLPLSGAGAIINSVGGGPGIPAGFTLEQNYPNPFNPATQIRFGLPAASPVTLEVFDALGQLVATPLRRAMEAGWHTVRWEARGGDGSALPSGLYLARLSAGTETRTIKLLLVR
jgi:glucose/arabinose dehydrogenase